MRRPGRRITRTSGQRWRDRAFLIAIHVIPAAAVVRGTTTRDWIACAGFYVVAAMATGIGLHRYFAHHAFRTSRAFQFVLAVFCCAIFAEPMSFAGKHRLHHRHADTDADVHSPIQGFWFCWYGSLIDEGYRESEILAMTPDLLRFPELVALRAWFWLPGIVVAGVTWWWGGFSKFAIGYCLSLALLINLVSSVNYFCHVTGVRRYPTRDHSTNNAFVALLTFGEGWHNNHHHWPRAARAGIRWWEIDLVYYAIRLLACLGIVWAVRDVPNRLRHKAVAGL